MKSRGFYPALYIPNKRDWTECPVSVYWAKTVISIYEACI